MTSAITTLNESKHSKKDKALVAKYLKNTKATHLDFLEEDLIQQVVLFKQDGCATEESIPSTLQLPNIKLKLIK